MGEGSPCFQGVCYKLCGTGPARPSSSSPAAFPSHSKQTYGVRLAVPERTNEVAGQYAAAAEALAAELGVPCLNLWRAFQVGLVWEAEGEG